MRLLKIVASLGWLIFALPITCADYTGNDLYTGGVTPSGSRRPDQPRRAVAHERRQQRLGTVAPSRRRSNPLRSLSFAATERRRPPEAK